ncbi:MAG: hypothetical protein LBQ16_03345 [Gracilibacteraceae bacterium]|jgi:hypothetical protein|nr:hypothetical protein [Gracilibacteraceae bacterium]
MPLWERGEADPDIRFRKYKCPECGKHSLHVKHGSFAECGNGCFISDETVIARVLDGGDYAGRFTREELETDFI